MADNDKDLRQWLESAGNVIPELTGNALGAVISYLTGDLPGAVIGGAATPLLTLTIRTVGEEIRRRVLGPREDIRVGGAIFFATKKFRDNLDAGKQVRQDGFFTQEDGDRTAAKEITEGVLITAQRDYEEKKLKYYGNLLGNLAFRVDVDRNTANALLKLAGRLSYHQLCYLALMARKGQFRLAESSNKLGDFITHDIAHDDSNYAALAADVFDLIQQRVLWGNPNSVNDQEFVTRVSNLGFVLYELMALDEIDNSDLTSIVTLLNDVKKNDHLRGMSVGFMPIDDNNVVRVDKQYTGLLLRDGNNYTIDGVPARISHQSVRFSDLASIPDASLFVTLEDESGRKFSVHVDALKRLGNLEPVTGLNFDSLKEKAY